MPTSFTCRPATGNGKPKTAQGETTQTEPVEPNSLQKVRRNFFRPAGDALTREESTFPQVLLPDVIRAARRTYSLGSNSVFKKASCRPGKGAG